MKQRTKVGVVLALAMAVAACGSDAMDLVGDAMVDAGEAMRDADRADAMDDAAAGDDGAAADGHVGDGGEGPAATVMEASCDQRFQVSAERYVGGISIIERTKWFARFEVDGLRPSSAPVLSAVVCGRRTFGEGDPRGSLYGQSDACEAGEDPEVDGCTIYEGELEPLMPCQSVTYDVDDGVVRVPCGYRDRDIDPDSGEPGSPRGLAWETAYLRVR